MILGRLYCRIRRLFGKRHRYFASPAGGRSCIYCGKAARERKAKMPLDTAKT